MNQLEQARAQIDTVDRQMAALFEQRMAAVRQVIEYKQATGMPILDSGREAQVIEKNTAYIAEEVLRPYYADLLRAQMALSRQYQAYVLGRDVVAHQGAEGAYSHIALTRLFPRAKALSLATFDEVFDAVQDGRAAYGEDLNGDGKVAVKLNVYTMDFGNEDSDAYLDMAGTTKLSTDIQGALSSIFILYDPAGFQQTTGTLRYLDGSLPQSDADSDWWNMVYRWTDCPALAGLDLGDYTSDAVQSASGSSQELLSHYYIGIRGAWNKDSADLLEGGEDLWNALTAGAVSTVTEEG